MVDEDTTIKELKDKVAAFVADRRWEPYHSPRNLAGSICIEAAELLEIFQWEEVAKEDARTNAQLMTRISDEAADVMIYIISLANALDMDLSEAIARKISSNAKKYPV
jgi:NTP pyrophosphatase (non-canonical NTP hydrolase)